MRSGSAHGWRASPKPKRRQGRWVTRLRVERPATLNEQTRVGGGTFSKAQRLAKRFQQGMTIR
jgi:hypothetical protein